VPRDLRARWHGAQLGERELERRLDETADLELPIGKSVRRQRPVGVVVDARRPVRLEVPRDVGLAIFAGERICRNERALARVGQGLGLIENALDPRLLGQLAVAATGERRSGDGEAAREESAPVEFRLRAHDWPSGSLIT
jgi:hypothetical protein